MIWLPVTRMTPNICLNCCSGHVRDPEWICRRKLTPHPFRILYFGLKPAQQTGSLVFCCWNNFFVAGTIVIVRATKKNILATKIIVGPCMVIWLGRDLGAAHLEWICRGQLTPPGFRVLGLKPAAVHNHWNAKSSVSLEKRLLLHMLLCLPDQRHIPHIYTPIFSISVYLLPQG